MTKKVVLLVLVLAFAATQVQTLLGLGQCPPECGKDRENTECPNNLCCSGGGLCGLGRNYCSAANGCQSGACQASAACGRDQPCPNNQCCNKDGKCGIGSLYCGDGCQSGPCREDLKCGLQPDGSQEPGCPNNLCCNKAGRCGLGDRYCSNTEEVSCQSGACYDDNVNGGKCGWQNGNRACPGNLCCSNWGNCGDTDPYCGLACQPRAGRCDSRVIDLTETVECLLPSLL